MQLTTALRQEYEHLYRNCQIRQARLGEVNFTVDRILKHQKRYEDIQDDTDVPWYFIAIVHQLEASGRFDTHLHNGDSLKSQTIRVPSKRPPHGTPPFTWEESAIDALEYHRLTDLEDWSLAAICYQFEKYNGFGYRLYHSDVPSPYLWSFSNHYIRGKYVADGRFDPNAVSLQCGALVLLKCLEEKRMIFLSNNQSQPATWFEVYSHREDDRSYPVIAIWAGTELLDLVEIKSRRTAKIVSLFQQYPTAKTFLVAPEGKNLPSL